MKTGGRTRHDAGAFRQNFKAKTSFKSQVISSGICGGQIGTVTDFRLSITSLPC